MRLLRVRVRVLLVWCKCVGGEEWRRERGENSAEQIGSRTQRACPQRSKVAARPSSELPQGVSQVWDLFCVWSR